MTSLSPAAEFARSDIVLDSCWKRIGVLGDKSCPALPQHSHCRNCPSFSLAAAAMLDRQASEELASPADQAARLDRGGEVPTESVTVFRLGAEWFAVPTIVLDEIVTLRPIHALPHRRNPALLGLANVRGELVICISLQHLLALAPQGEAAGAQLVVLRHPGGRFAFPVDEVEDIHRHSPDDLQPPPATLARSASSLTLGMLPWNGKAIGRLDERLLFDALDRSLT